MTQHPVNITMEMTAIPQGWTHTKYQKLFGKAPVTVVSIGKSGTVSDLTMAHYAGVKDGKPVFMQPNGKKKQLFYTHYALRAGG